MASDLIVDPLTVEANVPAGQDLTGVIHVSLGPGKTAAGHAAPGARQHIVIRLGDWDMTPSGGLVFGPPGKWPLSCARYIQLNPVEFDLDDGGQMDVRYTVHLPPDAPDGTYRAIIFSQTAPSPVVGKNGVSFAAAIGTILYVTRGPHSRKARVTGFVVDPAGARIRVQNRGTDHLRITGTIKIEDRAGALVRELPLPPTVILPGADRYREITVPFPDDLHLAPGRYLVTAILNYRGDTLIGVRKSLVIHTAR